MEGEKMLLLMMMNDRKKNKTGRRRGEEGLDEEGQCWKVSDRTLRKGTELERERLGWKGRGRPERGGQGWKERNRLKEQGQG